MNAHRIDELSGKAYDTRVFSRLVYYIRPHIFAFSGALLLIFISTAITLYIPRLLGNIVDRALIPRDQKALFIFAFFYLGLETARWFTVFIQSVWLQKIGQNILHTLRGDLYGRLLRMPVVFYDRNPIGRLVTRLTNDIANLAELFSAAFVVLIGDILLIVGILATVIVMNWKLGLVSICVFPIMVFLMSYFAKKLRKAFRETRQSLSMLNGFFAERMSGMSTIQLMNREEVENAKFCELSEDYKIKHAGTIFIYAFFQPSVTILSSISMGLVLWYGGKLTMQGELPLGVFVAYLSYIQYLYQPIRNLTEKYNIYQNAMASAERVFSILDMTEEEGLREHETYKKQLSEQMSGKIDFQNIWFHYDVQNTRSESKQWALKATSFTIEPGETIAVVGHTGAGKTSLISLLLRFYEPQVGKIFLDGKDIQSIPKVELRSKIGLVQQDVFLFAGTIRENLSILSNQTNDAEIIEAAKLTGFDKILSRLPQGLNTLLDERGTNLSLGERQILAFTRAVLQKPSVLVLDEATSHMDTESEMAIQNATHQVVRGRTAVIIAHRLSTIKEASRILVFHRGEIVESGTHAELIKKRGYYFNYFKLQQIQSPNSATGAQSTASM